MMIYSAGGAKIHLCYVEIHTFSCCNLKIKYCSQTYAACNEARTLSDHRDVLEPIK